MTKIYIIRHAEAEGNYYRRIHGQYDSKITPRGYKQIDALAERFKDIHLDALYSSDLFRTRTTAGAIVKYHDLELHTTPRLREVAMGIWEDEPWGNVEYYDGEQMLNFARDPEKWDIEGGEEYHHLKDRMVSILTELGKKHDGETIAVTSHGMIIRTFLAYLMNIPGDRISEIPHGDNTCVALVEYENEAFKLDWYNDNSHLSNEISTFANQKWWKNHAQIDTANLRFEPLNLRDDAQLFVDCYAKAWNIAHGDLSNFSSAPYLREAEEVSESYPDFGLMKIFSGYDFAGIVELDPTRMKNKGRGWISFCYIEEPLRNQGFGVQLIGHAISHYRRLGRSALALNVAESNKNAVGFYEHLGFKTAGKSQGAGGALLLMEMPI